MTLTSIKSYKPPTKEYATIITSEQERDERDAMKTPAVLATTAVIAVLFAFTLLYPYYEFVDPFSFSSASLTKFYVLYKHIVIEPFRTQGFYKDNVNWLSYRPSSSLVFLFISSVVGINIEENIYLPIPGILNILLVFLMGRMILSERNDNKKYRVIHKILVLFFVSIAVVINTGPALVGTNYYISLGYTYVFLYTYLLFKTVKEAKISKGSMVTLIITSLVSVLTYYTASFMIISLNLILLILLLLNKPRFENKNNIKIVLLNLLVISVVAYSHEKTFYEYFARAISNRHEVMTQLTEGIMSIMVTFFSLFTGRKEYASVKHTFRHYIELSNIFGRAYIISLSLLGLIIILYFVVTLISKKKLMTLSRLEKISLVSFLFIALSQIAVYFIFGEYNYSMAWVLVSLIFLIYLNKVFLERKSNIIKYVTVALLLIATVSGFGKQYIYISDNVFTDYYSLNRNAAEFFLEHTLPDNPIVLVDHKLYALSVYESIDNGIYDNISFAFLNKHTKIDKQGEVYYIEPKDVPFIYLGVKGVVAKEEVFRSVFGSLDLRYVARGIIYDSNTTRIWKIN